MEELELKAKELAAAGKNRGEIEYALVRHGLDQQSAETIARKYGPRGEADALVGATGDGGADMVIGGVMLAAGLGITVASYSSAAGGGTYFVTWGLMAAGMFRFIRGLGKP